MATPSKSLKKKFLSNHLKSSDVALEPADNKRLANLCGQFDENLRQLERRLGVEINGRDNVFRVIGDPALVRMAEDMLHKLYAETERVSLTPAKVHLFLQEAGIGAEPNVAEQAAKAQDVVIKGRRGEVKALGPNQQRYLKNITTHDINFGVGPAWMQTSVAPSAEASAARSPISPSESV